MSRERSDFPVCAEYLDDLDEENSNHVEEQNSDQIVIEQNFNKNLSRKEENSQNCFEVIPVPIGNKISLPLENIESLCFYETFLISKQMSCWHANIKPEIVLSTDDNDLETMGSACVVVEQLEDGNLMVYATLQHIKDNGNISIEVLSVVNNSLQLIHEKRIERTSFKGKFMEKVLNIFPIENGSFRLIKSKTEDEKTEYWRSNVEWKKTGDFLCFGATVLLIRHLTRELFEGCIHSWDCDMEGNFAIVIQTFRKIQIAVISDQKVEAQQVDLKIIPFNEQVFTSASFHLAGNGNGRIINSMSCSSPLIFHPHSLFNKSGSQRNKSDDWEKDLQLVSMYLDFKTEEKNKKHEKCEDSQNSHPEVTLQDYIQCLIKSKPQNVMNFTVDFVRKLEHDGNVLAYQTTPHRHQQI